MKPLRFSKTAPHSEVHRSLIASRVSLRFAPLFLGFALAHLATPAQATDPATPDVSSAASKPNERKSWTEEVANPTALGVGLESSADKPWMRHVSAEQQDAAERLFAEGNALFLESRFKEAAQKYRDALALWDHPTTHYNLALTLVNLDDPLGAYHHLREAFKYGGAPLEPKYQQEARRHLKTAGRQITELEVVCEEPNARVSLDGEEIFVAPKQRQLVLLPGKHTVSVMKPGYLSRTYTLTLVPGEPVKLVARIYDEATLTETTRPLPFWLPVVVTGVGATVLGGGVIMGLQSNRLFARLDDEIKNDPACAMGCRLAGSQQSMQHDAQTYKTWATASVIAGSVTVVAGGTWMWLNRKRVRLETPDEYERHVSIAPLVGSNALGAMAAGRF